jgi:hypothetical protein
MSENIFYKNKNKPEELIIDKNIISDILSNKNSLNKGVQGAIGLNSNSYSKFNSGNNFKTIEINISNSKSESIQIFKINAETKPKKAEEEEETPVQTHENIIKNEVVKNNSVINNSSISIDILERISKIDNKLNNINLKVDSSGLIDNKNNLNLDSRVKSENDISGMEESMIIKNKSFLSFNNNYKR